MRGQSVALLAALIENTEDLIWAVDLNYRIIALNSSFQRAFETTFDIRPAVGMRSDDFLPREKAEVFPPLYERAMSAGLVQADYRFCDDRTIEMTLKPIFIDGLAVGISVYAKETSAPQANEEQLATVQSALKASENYYRTIFQMNLDAVTIIHRDSDRYIDVNQAFLDGMGYERREVIGRSVHELNLWTNPVDQQGFTDLLRRESGCRHLETEFRNKSGEIVSGIVSATIIELDGVSCVLSILRDITKLKNAEIEARNLAFCDPLTGLPNRRSLVDRLEHTLKADAQTERRRALLLIDLDHFKSLNDTLGHHAGDLLLQETSRRLVACAGDNGTVARLGGDEFVVVLNELSDSSEDAVTQSRGFGENVISAIAQPHWLVGRECISTVSIGITLFGEKPEAVNEILQHAEIAMYRAKAAGRNTICFFAPSLQVDINARASMEWDLRHAIKANQFVLYYQPQVDSTGVIGAEALIRWNHPKRGILSPGEFIPLAEETGLIHLLGDWVLDAAGKQIAEWANRSRTANIPVAVNISARQFCKRGFVKQVLAMLDSTKANPKNLRLELTESMLVDCIEAVPKMTEFRSLGIGLSLDDFGTGFSSLSYLKRLPLDQLKIDRSFVRDIIADPGSRAIAQAVISLGRALDLSVIAEGVETEEQLDILANLGCNSFQGYLFSCPLPLEEFELLLPVLTEMCSAILIQS